MNKQHVQVPTIEDLKKKNLKPKDLLVYAAIAKFKNSKTNEAYPSIKTISKEIGVTAPTIAKSVAALEAAGLITVSNRDGHTSIYKFTDYSSFEMFSYDFLEKTDLSYMEKAYIISIQSKLIKNPTTHTGSTSYTNSELSQMLNMDRSTISNVDKSLQGKGMLDVVKTKENDPETGLSINQKIFNFNEFANGVVFEFGVVDSRLNSVEKEQELQRRKTAEMEDKLRKMERVLKAKDINYEEVYKDIENSIKL